MKFKAYWKWKKILKIYKKHCFAKFMLYWFFSSYALLALRSAYTIYNLIMTNRANLWPLEKVELILFNDNLGGVCANPYDETQLRFYGDILLDEYAIIYITTATSEFKFNCLISISGIVKT